MSEFRFRKPWERGDRENRSERQGGYGDRSFRRSAPQRSSFRKPWERDDREDRPEHRDSVGRSGDYGDRSFRRDAPRRPSFRKPWERDGRSEDAQRRQSFHKPWERDERIEDNKFRPSFRKPWEGDERSDGGERRRQFEKRDRPKRDFKPPKPRTAPIPEAGELIFGRQPVREILRAGRRPVSLVVMADGVKESEEINEIQALAVERGARIEKHSREDIEAWVNGANHQGVVAFCEDYPYAELDEIADALASATGSALVVVLDHIQDPQNLGSILRTCECAGVLGVVLPVDRAAAVTAAAVRASAGASEHMKIARVSNLVAALERFKGIGAWITGLEATEGAKPCTQVDFKGKVCLVIGSEAHGLCSPVKKACDFLARIPLCGRVNSLNAGVAAGLAIYEALRQQGAYDNPANFPTIESAEDNSVRDAAKQEDVFSEQPQQ